MEMTTAKPAAGWYTDPADSANERWWGGLDWTDHVRPLAVAPSYEPTAPMHAAAPPAPQLAAPSAHAAHLALPQHLAESPLSTPTPEATASPAETAPEMDTPEMDTAPPAEMARPVEPVALGQLAFSAMPASDLVASFAAAFDAAPPVPGSAHAAAVASPAPVVAAPVVEAPVVEVPVVAAPVVAAPVVAAPVAAAPAPAPFTAPPAFSITTPEPTPAPAPLASAPAAPVAAAAPAPVRDLSTMPPPAYTPPLALASPVAAPVAAPQSAVAAPAPVMTPPPAPAEPVAEAPQLASPLPPPTGNGLVMTPAPAPIAIAPIAAAAGTSTGDLPEFATAAVATIPQYASQLQPVTETSLGQPVAAWDAIPAAGAPGLFSAAPLPTASSPFRNSPPPAPGTAMTAAPSWVNGGYEKPMAPPSNGKATAGFVLSLVGFTIVGLFVSISGLRKARELESMGMPPVGRTLARWGVGISTVSIVLTIILVSFIATVGTAMFPILQTNGLLTSSGPSSTVFEASVWDALTIETDLDVDTVSCPASASTDPGSVVDCSVTLADGEVISVRTTFADDGSRTTEQLT